jgi:7-carboxy-7-deazaguanine synthase
MAKDRLRINEIFHSIQGEGTRAGVRCTFVRLTGCHLRCTWCDTEYAFYDGSWLSLDEIIATVKSHDAPYVQITGGEPLLQPAVYPLMQRLADRFTVLLETAGAISIAQVDPRVIRIMDLKCPGSGESDRNLWENIALLTNRDEVKFVLANRDDYTWTRAVIKKYDLSNRCAAVLLSPVNDTLAPSELAKWVIEDRLSVRVQLQLHKLIWPAQMRGV